MFDLAFSPATRDLLASGSDDGTAKVWRLRSACERVGCAHGPGTGQNLWSPEVGCCLTPFLVSLHGRCSTMLSGCKVVYSSILCRLV